MCVQYKQRILWNIFWTITLFNANKFWVLMLLLQTKLICVDLKLLYIYNDCAEDKHDEYKLYFMIEKIRFQYHQSLNNHESCQ